MTTSSLSVNTLRLPLPGATAFSTIRGCNDNESPYDGFNACDYTGDDKAHVESCRREVASLLDLDSLDKLILPRQTHTANVAVVDRHSRREVLTDIDALVTTDPSIAIGINTADCVPIVMSDSTAGIIAAVHSGWRGTIVRIAGRAVDVMVSLGASRSNIHCALGPYIHVDSYEVGMNLIDDFTKEFGPDPALWRSIGGKPHLNLGYAVRKGLADAGISAERISDVGLCSYTDYERLFSARRLGVASGRTLTVARLARSKASM